MARAFGIALVVLPVLGGGASGFTPLTEVWCLERAALVQHLTQRFEATQVGQGVRDRESVMELWADKSGEWTLVVSYASGRACVVSMGEAWETAMPLATAAPAGGG